MPYIQNADYPRFFKVYTMTKQVGWQEINEKRVFEIPRKRFQFDFHKD